jgi:hypothetical protein
MADSVKKQIIEVHYVDVEARAAARARAAEEQKLTKETAAVAAKAAKETAAAAQAAAKERATAHKAAVSTIQQTETDLTDKVKQQARAREQAAKAEFAAWKKASDEKHFVAMARFEEEQRALKQQQQATNASTAAVMGWMGAYATIGTVIQGVKGIADYMDQIRRDTFSAAQEVIGFRKEVLELAAMKDQLGQSGPETAGQLVFRSKTLQTRQAALAMSTAAEGAGQAAIGVNISREAFREGLEGIGKLQAMEQSDPRAYGKFAATIALQAQPGTTAGQMKGTANKLFNIQKPGGFESFAQFAKQNAETSSFVQNKIYTDAENAALLSALSLNNPETAATRLEQITRATSSGLMRDRGIKAAPGIEHDTSGAYFQKLGITEGMPAMERLQRITDDVTRAQDTAAKNGKPFLTTEYLMKEGIRNTDDAQAIMDFAGTKRKGLWEKTFVPLINAAADPNAIDQIFDAQKGREPVLMDQVAENAREAAQVKRSLSPEGQLSQIQKAAFARLHGEKEMAGTFEEWKNRGFLQRVYYDATGGFQSRVDSETQRMLQQEAKRTGIDWHAPRRTDPRSGLSTELYAGDKALFELQQRIQQAGGDPMAGAADDMKAAAAALLDAAKAIAPTAPIGGPRGGFGATGAPVGNIPAALPGPLPAPARAP